MTDKPKRNPKGSGRKRIIIKPEAVEQLAAQGLGPTQIARALGVGWGVIDGNVTAQIFYLKNRDESNWRDRVETTTNHQISLSQVLDSAKKRVINITPEPKRVNKSSINQGKQGDDK